MTPGITTFKSLVWCIDKWTWFSSNTYPSTSTLILLHHNIPRLRNWDYKTTTHSRFRYSKRGPIIGIRELSCHNQSRKCNLNFPGIPRGHRSWITYRWSYCSSNASNVVTLHFLAHNLKPTVILLNSFEWLVAHFIRFSMEHVKYVKKHYKRKLK